MVPLPLFFIKTVALWSVMTVLIFYIRETTDIRIVINQREYIVNENEYYTSRSITSNRTTNNDTGKRVGQENHPPSRSITSNCTTNNDTGKRVGQENHPHWAYKLDFMEKPEDIPDDKRICFVHVGKTAGSTLACFLGFHSDHCATGMNETESKNIPKTRDIEKAQDILKQMIPNGNLAHYTTSQMHRSIDTCIDHAPISLYLFVVRNPFARIKSWFQYERVDNTTTTKTGETYIQRAKLFIECEYDTLNKLGGDTGLGARNGTSCSRRAFRAISGMWGYATHNKYNYGYYYNKVMKQQQQEEIKNSRIVVIRTEHLEKDWSTIETQILNGPSLPNDFKFVNKNKSLKLPEDTIIDDTSKQNVCEALCQEIQMYKTILKESENLDEIAYSESMSELALDCPNQAANDTCF